MTIFKSRKPFISYRIYMCVEKDDTDTARQFNLEWDSEYKTWYLDGHKYIESKIAKQANIRKVLKPFQVWGKHQLFL
jgi:hypothetical protein